MSKYLVTGAAGFIGSNLVERLLDNGEEVVAFDNFSTGNPANLVFAETHPNYKNYTFIEGDIRYVDACRAAMDGVDYVLHQAALGSVPRSVNQPHLYHDNNLSGTMNMLLAAKDAGVKTFVSASSSSVYGNTPTLPKIETMTPTPLSPYAVGKLTGEHYSSVFHKIYGLNTVSLRYFNVYGAKQDPNSLYAAVIPKFIKAYMTGDTPIVHGDGEQTRDFTYIDNVVKANLNACKATDPETFGKAYNIGCGGRLSINDLVLTIKSILNGTNDPKYIETRAGDVRDSQASVTLAEKYLGYTDLIDLKAGLEKTIQWYLDQDAKAKGE